MLFLVDEQTCLDMWTLINLIKHGLIPIIQIGIPIILIILGMFDLGKAVMASKEDEIKSAQKLLIKRVIYAIAIFFVVFLVTVIFNLVGRNGGENSADWAKCWNCEPSNGQCTNRSVWK